jgi:hypothetical protein
VCRKINAGLSEYLQRHRVARLADLTGTLETTAPVNQACG